MKLKRKTKLHYVLPPIIAAGIAFDFKMINDGVFTLSSPYVYFAPTITIIIVFFTYIRLSKPLASVIGDTLTIDGQLIDKNTVEHMNYEIESERYHNVIIKMNGHSEHTITIENKHKELDDLRLYKFITNNFYPINLLKSD